MGLRRRTAPLGGGPSALTVLVSSTVFLLFFDASSSSSSSRSGGSFFGGFGPVIAGAARSALAPSAVHLNDDSFDAVLGRLADDEHALMEFYMPWCPACQNFAPIYERVAAFFNKGITLRATVEGPRPTPHVTAFSVDCQANGQLCNVFNVRSYPHVLFGVASKFKTRASNEGLESFTPFSPKTAERMVQMVGERTGSAAHTLLSLIHI